jgi:acetyl esterase/lipase
MHRIVLSGSRLAAASLLAAGLSSWPLPAAAEPISWSEVQALPLPVAGQRIAYGADPEQFGELRLPAKVSGKVPVIVLLHGGCWLNQFDYRYMTRLAAALTDQGYATWTPEFRRLGDAAGGWPNTLRDAALATDHLAALAQQRPLDLRRVIIIGHSSGGQLALWLAARARLPPGSPLYRPHPLRPRAVIGLDAITDLQSYRIGPPGSCNTAVDELMDGTPQTQPRHYAESSPMALLPLGVPQWLIQGGDDSIVSAESAHAYAAAAARAGDRISLLEQPGSGHFESVVPAGAAWQALLAAVSAALR